AFVVALTMLASLTLLPAMLGFYGLKALRRGERRQLEREGPQPEEVEGLWLGWAEQSRSRAGRLSGRPLALMVSLALAFFSMRLGRTVAANARARWPTRQAYDPLARGSGPGFNGPLQIAGEINRPEASAHFASFVRSLDGLPGVATVVPPRASPNGKAEVAI